MTGVYYGNINPELLRWAPLQARDVLEIGCGEGALAAAYKRRNPAARYTAIEAHGPAAAVARGRVDRLLEADVTVLSAEQLEALGRFDAVVMGDVLEHLADPWDALRRVRQLLRPQGWLALSVPNAGHWSVLAELVCGRWPAHDSGLFDRTHLRWFTLQSLKEVLGEAGFTPARARPRNVLLDRDKAQAWGNALATAAETMGVAREPFLQRAQALQWVVCAGRDDARRPERLHLHFAAITPDFLDVRMRLPAEALMSDPTLNVTYAEKTAALPQLAREQPKIAVVQRLALASEEVVRRYVDAAEAQGWVVVFEIDDHPDLIGQVQRSDVGRLLDATLRGFHAVQTSTARLGEALSGRNPEVAVFRNAVFELPPPRAVDADGPVRIFHGALNREGFTATVAATLGDVAGRPDVEFVVVHDRAFFTALPGERKRFHAAASYSEYLALMAGCDIVLSPLQGAPNELHKSDVKFVEAGAAGAAMIASAPVYADTIVDGGTGLIARDLPDWPRLLGRLLDDAHLRRRLGAAARAYVVGERMMADQLEERVDWYRRLWRDRDRLRARRARHETVAAASP